MAIAKYKFIVPCIIFSAHFCLLYRIRAARNRQINLSAKLAIFSSQTPVESCPWVGLTYGLGWVGSTTAKVLKI